jgi:hypothetical protein
MLSKRRASFDISEHRGSAFDRVSGSGQWRAEPDTNRDHATWPLTIEATVTTGAEEAMVRQVVIAIAARALKICEVEVSFICRLLIVPGRQ